MKLHFFGLVLLSLFAFSSCQKDNLKNDKSELDVKQEDAKTDCFMLTYPLTYVMPDQSLVTGANEDAVNQAIKAWYSAHPDSKEKYNLLYPVEVTFEDGTIKMLADAGEMALAKHDCTGSGAKICFDFIYPLSYTMPDGSIVTGGDKETINEAIKAWYVAHPDSKEKYSLNFPIEVKFEDGTIKILENEEDLKKAWAACKGDDGDKICFDLIYPLSYTMPDGSIVTGVDEDAVNLALKEWYAAHPDSKEKYTLIYPVDIKYNDGTIATIADEAAMIQAKKDCWGDEDGE